MAMTVHDVWKAGSAGIDGIELLRAWNRLVDLLPPKHHVWVQGPYLDGHITCNVVDTSKAPSKTIVTAHGDTLARALNFAYDSLKVGLEEQVDQQEAAVGVATQPRIKGRFAKKVVDAPIANPMDEITGKIDAVWQALQTDEGKARFDAVFAAISAPRPRKDPEPEKALAPGFTRDRDLVAHLVWKNARVSQYELRHQYGIKNPAQAINDAEDHYGFTMETGASLPNGDVPYRLVGKAPAVEGMLPMFTQGAEDPDEKLYVLELDLYSCETCGRHPVYRPQQVEGGYTGVCPRHGLTKFERL